MMVRTLVLAGMGINCEEETARAFRLAGSEVDTRHVHDVSDLVGYQIVAFPGGFSYGDHTGSGKALANYMKRLGDELHKHVDDGGMVLGICNGFQVLTQLGLLGSGVGLTHNDSARYVARWVDVEFMQGPWTRGLGIRSLPIAHGEGKFFHNGGVNVAGLYVRGEMHAEYGLPANPNGSQGDIMGITDSTGRVLGMMPHPERAVDFLHLPNWSRLAESYRREGLELPSRGPGLELFENGVGYFK